MAELRLSMTAAMSFETGQGSKIEILPKATVYLCCPAHILFRSDALAALSVNLPGT